MAEDNSDDTPTDGANENSAQKNLAKRRRTSANPSSRGVANLTPEQLARKRANDREAQRAIRERTKNQIDRLNTRIRELESQQPYHELQVVLRQKEAIQAENEDIKKRLASVLSIIQPILRAQGLNELAAAAERSPLPGPPQQEAASAQQLHPPDPRGFHSGLIRFNDVVPQSTPPNASPPNAPSPNEQGSSTRHWPFPGDPPTSHVRGWPGGSPPYDQHRSQVQHDMGFGHCDERLGVDYILDSNHQRIKLGNGGSAHHQSPIGGLIGGPNEHAIVAHTALPRSSGPTCPLDGIMLDFLADRQARAAEGVPVKTLVGPMYPNFTALLYPDRQVESHALSKLFTDILRTFPDICGLPEQVATVFVMFLVMRWQIEPTQENYDRLPDWATPRPSQLFTPHPCWMDHLPWPRLRDRIIATSPLTSFDTFFIPYTTTISLNWPYEARDCLLPASTVSKTGSSAFSTTSSQFSGTSPYSTAIHAGSPPCPPTPGPTVSTPGAGSREDEEWIINPAFESHLRNLGNWSLGPSFRTSFPHFADCVRIKEGR
ncbi:hypothetical protein K432DRAFT_393016 [Lepidopterella palustris CBS 459.81]|uniref:BZIP transcription factor n=1 Tax=Lepidopterella palustris CBS 459.81 TaxID=1314670 RepID=A0A8E2EAM8_9PEZI|nr:hypothetical protein K432DRAFT_393016 [Lepidopterella palustris CBS 459.81]